MQDLVSWEKLQEKGYYVVPTDKDWKDYPRGLAKFHEDPAGNPLTTPTGKIEFYATGLAEHFPDDEERPPVPHYIPYGVSHQESLQPSQGGEVSLARDVEPPEMVRAFSA